jgi:hypothetical protein
VIRETKIYSIYIHLLIESLTKRTVLYIVNNEYGELNMWTRNNNIILSLLFGCLASFAGGNDYE